MLLQLARTTDPPGFRLVGEIDISNVATLADALERDVESGGDITLDLSGLVFLDSTAIQIIIRTAQRLHGKGNLVLVQPGGLVQRTLERVGLGQLSNVRIVSTSLDGRDAGD